MQATSRAVVGSLVQAAGVRGEVRCEAVMDLVEQQMDGRAMVGSQVYAAGVSERFVERQQRSVWR